MPAYQVPEFKTAKICSVNTRSEKHGPEKLVPAVDVGITQTIPNTQLEELAPGLLHMLYKKASDQDDGQVGLDGVEAVSDFPVLRFPKMAPIKWAQIQESETFTISHGLGGASDIVLTECKVSGFVITAKEGGSVELKYKVQSADGLDERTLGKLALLVQHEVPIKLVSGESDDQQDIENPLPFSKEAGEDDIGNPFPSALTPEKALADACAAEAVH